MFRDQLTYDGLWIVSMPPYVNVMSFAMETTDRWTEWCNWHSHTNDNRVETTLKKRFFYIFKTMYSFDWRQELVRVLRTWSPFCFRSQDQQTIITFSSTRLVYFLYACLCANAGTFSIIWKQVTGSAEKRVLSPVKKILICRLLVCI